MTYPTELPAEAPQRLHAVVATLEGQDRADCIRSWFEMKEASARETEAMNARLRARPWNQRGIGKYRGRLYVGRS